MVRVARLPELGREVKPEEHYAISLIAEGGQNAVDDDMQESAEAEALTEKQWRASLPIAHKMARAIGENRDSFLTWYRLVEEPALIEDGN